jgi:tetratricopeptide (TPR) repeat protein
MALYPPNAPGRLRAATQLGEALIARGEAARAERLLAATLAEAEATGDRDAEAHALLQLAFLRSAREGAAALLHAAERAIPLFQQAGDELGLARAWWRLGQAHQTAGRHGEAARTFERALSHAARANGQLEWADVLGGLALSLWLGPEPAPRATARCRELLASLGGRLPAAEAAVSCPLAVLEAMQGRLDDAGGLLGRAREVVTELGHGYALATIPLFAATVAELAGDLATAERELRHGCEAFSRVGDRRMLSAAAERLAHVLVEQERAAEALRWLERARDLLDGAVGAPSSGLLATQARMLASQGAFEEAERLARDAVAAVERTDCLDEQAAALLDLALVRRDAGRAAEAAAAARAAHDRFQAKGNLAGVARAAALLRALERTEKAAGR